GRAALQLSMGSRNKAALCRSAAIRVPHLPARDPALVVISALGRTEVLRLGDSIGEPLGRYRRRTLADEVFPRMAGRPAGECDAPISPRRLEYRQPAALRPPSRHGRGLAPQRVAILGLVPSHARNDDAGLLSDRRRALQRRRQLLAAVLGSAG